MDMKVYTEGRKYPLESDGLQEALRKMEEEFPSNPKSRCTHRVGYKKLKRQREAGFVKVKDDLNKDREFVPHRVYETPECKRVQEFLIDARSIKMAVHSLREDYRSDGGLRFIGELDLPTLHANNEELEDLVFMVEKVCGERGWDPNLHPIKDFVGLAYETAEELYNKAIKEDHPLGEKPLRLENPWEVWRVAPSLIDNYVTLAPSRVDHLLRKIDAVIGGQLSLEMPRLPSKFSKMVDEPSGSGEAPSVPYPGFATDGLPVHEGKLQQICLQTGGSVDTYLLVDGQDFVIKDTNLKCLVGHEEQEELRKTTSWRPHRVPNPGLLSLGSRTEYEPYDSYEKERITVPEIDIGTDLAIFYRPCQRWRREDPLEFRVVGLAYRRDDRRWIYEKGIRFDEGS